MKKDLRMEGMSPDPDDLADEKPHEPTDRERDDWEELGGHKAQRDRSAPHVPPLEDGKIKGED
ncbi:MAG TPA: hypothetical protein VFO19_04285 [Vicinamibacterales bacterium]|nr:hypothetical protein [Vicinamibacterales bacterium]